MWKGVEAMRFKAGDKVRVKDIEGVTGNMKDMAGEVVTIKDNDWNSLSYQIHEDYGEYDWEWTDEMLEPTVSKTEKVQEDTLATKIEERNNKPVKMISDENLLNENDPIKPSHYRKGEIDLYESWYRTYPFNEFRAIMSAIAERYMKRDKDNRIQDLNKAIYTLSRLKEYEEMEE